ncbi:MAG: signal peptidase II [Chlamydiota bacterium]
MATLAAAALVLAADQLTKLWVRSAFAEEELTVVINGFFNLTYVRNRGGAFGIFQHRQMLFVVLSLATIAALAWFYRGFSPRRRVCRIAVGLILGGALGNLADRLLVDRDRCVIDWLDVHWGAYHWPAFNIADSAISVGVFVLLYYLLLKAEGGPAKGGGGAAPAG